MHIREWSLSTYQNVTEPCSKQFIWLQVNIGSSNGLIQCGNKSLPEPTLAENWYAIWCD